MTIDRTDLREDIAGVLDDHHPNPTAAWWARTAQELLDALEQAKARLQAVQDVLDEAEASINRHPAYTFSGQRMDPIVNGADIRRALDN